jgi:outer membrane protein OmpA-like peptidoglycan-associated protein
MDIEVTPNPDGSIGPIKLVTGDSYRIIVKRTGPDRVRLIGMFFELNKCFLLPTAMVGIRKVASIYEGHPSGQLLVVGHTDTSGPSDYNDTLSLERSRAVVAYLSDDVDAWLAFYADGIASQKRWGSNEDRLMLSALPEGGEPYFSAGGSLSAAVRKFQTDQGLQVDGIAGLNTRRALVTAYMNLDGTSVPAGTTVLAHGCGENFPDVPTGDDVKEPRNRRVEIFVFDPTIDPPPDGDNSGPDATDYPAWRDRVKNTFDFSADGEEDGFELRLHDEEAHPLPSTFYRILTGGAEPASGQADADGFITLDLPMGGPSQIDVEWGSDDPAGPFRFARSFFVHPDQGDDGEQDRIRLHNLGYDTEADFAAAAIAFQTDYQVDDQPEPAGLDNGVLPDASRKRLHDIFETLNCDASPDAQTQEQGP